MPRDLPIGNGNLLVNFDQDYQIRDLYWPHVGLQNHSLGHPFRTGVWVDHQFRWLSDPGWKRDLHYGHETLVTDVRLVHPDLALTLTFSDAVDFHEDLLIRRCTLTNGVERAREVRIFFHHDFHISGNEVGDTAYYEPERRAVIHYKGPRWFLINGAISTTDAGPSKPDAAALGTAAGVVVGVHDWACGHKEIAGREGTWRDAEDGELSGNAVAQGSVDSTVGFRLLVPGDGAAVLYYWVSIGENFDAVTRINKYTPDGTLASSWHPWYSQGQKELPIQEDETALVLWALWRYFEKFCSVEFVKPLYRRLITAAGDFLARYRDPETGLPLPSHDLWEERRGVLAFTVGAVWAGLIAAANFAEAFGEDERALTYRQAATEIRAGCDIHLWRPELGRFARMINRQTDGGWSIDPTVDAALTGLWQFGMYAADEPRIVQTMTAIRERLWVKTDVGGVARYESDYYQQVSQDIAHVPGNPWFICTLWLAQWFAETARTAEDLDQTLELLRWTFDHALPSGVLAEQVHPVTGAPLSVSPLTWSHAALISTVHSYLEARQRLRV